MQHRSLVAPCVLMLVACGSRTGLGIFDAPEPEPEPAPASGAARDAGSAQGPPPDATAPLPAPSSGVLPCPPEPPGTGVAVPVETLLLGDGVALNGIAGDDIIYSTTQGVFARPIDGSAPATTISTSTYTDVLAYGRAVALWSSPTSMSVWTRASGLVAIATSDALGYGYGGLEDFVASDDGSRIAYAETKTDGSMMIRVRDVASMANSALLTGTSSETGNAFNTNAGTCRPSLRFVGGTFLAEFCPGTDPNASAAKLVMVASGSGTVVRMDAPDGASPALSVQPLSSPDVWWSFDGTRAGMSSWRFATGTSGETVFVRRLDGKAEVLRPENAPMVLDDDVAEGTVLPDGSAVLYRTNGGRLKKMVVSTGDVTTIADGAVALLGTNPNGNLVFFSRNVVASSSPGATFDVHAVDHTAAAAKPVTLVPNAIVTRGAVNGTGTHVIFDDAQCGTRSIALDGGAVTRVKVSLSSSSWSTLPGAGSIISHACNIGCTGLFQSDVTTGLETRLSRSDDDVEPIYARGHRVVWQATPWSSALSPGIFAATVP